MNRKEIEQLKDSDKPFYGTEDDWYDAGCMDGLDAADADPDTSALWHNASEEPLLGAKVLCDNFDVEERTTEYSWNSYCKVFGITKWAYVNDLLPKGGEK